MPFLEFPDIIPIPNDDTTLWRYMDISKFLSMLGRNKLHFSRSDLLGDKWEGAYPPHVIQQLRNGFSALPFGEEASNVHIKYMTEESRRAMFISCWHKNESQSDAMWKIYAQSNEAVAISTTVKRLKDAVQTHPTNVLIGDVTYSDYLPDESYWSKPEYNSFLVCYAKRKCFAHEQEVRAMCWKVIRHEGGAFSMDTDESRTGIEMPVNLADLIKEVHISPRAATWFKDVVQEVLGRYGLNDLKVIQSTLYDGPVY